MCLLALLHYCLSECNRVKARAFIRINTVFVFVYISIYEMPSSSSVLGLTTAMEPGDCG